MNKEELIADLESKVVKVLVTHSPTTLNGGDKEYSFTCLVEGKPNVFTEESYSIRVINEGLENEKAGYVRKEPPSSLSDLEIGLGMAEQKYGSFTHLSDTKDGYKIRLADGTIKTVALNSRKDGLLEVASE
jgi:hypothetical protein